MKDQGVRIIPRELQIESHREGILGAGPRAWMRNAERLETAFPELGRNRSDLS